MTDDNPGDKKHDNMFTVLNLHGTNIHNTHYTNYGRSFREKKLSLEVYTIHTERNV